MSRTWIYHKTEAPKIVQQSDAGKYYSKGWADTPAKFLKLEDHDIDPGDVVKVQQLGDAVEGVKNALNYELMTKKELVNYAKETFDANLSTRNNKEYIITEIEGLIALGGIDIGNSTENN